MAADQKLLSIGCWLAAISLFSGCRSVQVGPLDLEPAQHSQLQLDKAFVETAALEGRWKDLLNHIAKVDPDSLPYRNKAYAYYWLGVSQYKLHQYQAAQNSWDKAKNTQPSEPLKGMVQKAQHALLSYGHRGDRAQAKSQGYWALQYGIFSLRKSAEDLASNLSWKGAEVQIEEILHRGKTSWVVWSGPHSGQEAEQAQQKWRSKKIACIIKPISKIRP